MRLIEIIIPILLLIPSFFIVRLIDVKLIDKLSSTHIFKKCWNICYFFIILGVVFLLRPIANSIVSEPWVKTPALSLILNENNNTLKKLSITEIEINSRSLALEYRGGKLIKNRGTYANVITGYELQTNVEDFYVTGIYLLKGFKAHFEDGKWVSEVPNSVITHDFEVAKKQVKKLIELIDKHFINRKKAESTWE